MRGEYKALGVDFEERNPRFDEAIEVLRGIWSEEDFVYEGSTFEAKGQTSQPQALTAPTDLDRRQQPHVAAPRRPYGDGWSPFPAPRVLSNTAETPPLGTVDDLRVMLDELVAHGGSQQCPGRIDIAFGTSAGSSPGSDTFNPEAHWKAMQSWRNWA